MTGRAMILLTIALCLPLAACNDPDSGEDHAWFQFRQKPKDEPDPKPKRTFEIDPKTLWADPAHEPSPAPEERSFADLFRKRKPAWKVSTQPWPKQDTGWTKSVSDEEQEGLLDRLTNSDHSSQRSGESDADAGAAKKEIGFSLSALFGHGLGSSRGVDWSIMCREFRGDRAREQAQQVAEALRHTQGIRPDRVFVQDDAVRSRVFYGKYERIAPGDGSELTIPVELRNDARLIKELAVQGEHYFIESRMMPYPKPDVGNPEWSIESNTGVNTLRVAVFYPQAGFSDWKLAASEYCRELREKGYPAFYRHGDFSSEVCVGSFGEDAMVKSRKQGILVAIPGPEIQALQAKENFRYELWNLKTLADASDSRLMRASQVVAVRDEAAPEWAAR